MKEIKATIYTCLFGILLIDTFFKKGQSLNGYQQKFEATCLVFVH